MSWGLSSLLQSMAGEIVLDFFDVSLLFDVKLIYVDTPQLLLEPSYVVRLVPYFRLGIKHEIMHTAYLIQILQFRRIFSCCHSQHLSFQFPQLITYSALHEPALQFLLPLVVLGQFCQEQSQFIIQIPYFQCAAGQSKPIMHVLRMYVDFELNLSGKEHVLNMFVPAMQFSQYSASTMAFLRKLCKGLQLKDHLLAKSQTTNVKIRLKEMSQRNNSFLFFSSPMDYFLRTLMERLVIGSLVLLETIDGITKGLTSFDLTKISKCGIGESHGGLASAFPHKIISEIVRQKHDQSSRFDCTILLFFDRIISQVICDLWSRRRILGLRMVITDLLRCIYSSIQMMSQDMPFQRVQGRRARQVMAVIAIMRKRLKAFRPFLRIAPRQYRLRTAARVPNAEAKPVPMARILPGKSSHMYTSKMQKKRETQLRKRKATISYKI